ncbi:proteasome regulatory protein, putative [Hepatocystis sp. ex Piliocolobus tephrosceles]|nr:proteasome regulatory protein, putative [Hepatocystis sp. ex Piliocolobus tephrosceles]
MDLEKFNELMKKRNKVENEIKENLEFLESDENKNIGMKGKLVDFEGFPRNDIDIYAIRVARNKVICLKNDYLDLTNKIETYLHEIHRTQPVLSLKRNKQNINNNNNSSDLTNEHEILEFAKKNIFAIINEVVENSPAHKAGLRSNDFIFQFGDILLNKNELNPEQNTLQLISNYVQTLPKKIDVKVLRGEQVFSFTISPNQESNRLYIGCHLVPIKNGHA